MGSKLGLVRKSRTYMFFVVVEFLFVCLGLKC